MTDVTDLRQRSKEGVFEEAGSLGAAFAKAKAIPTHPIHFGIDMRVHHIISQKGIELSGLAPQLKWLEYDISSLPNLVLLPCTLQGACHLGVQVHRGCLEAVKAIDEANLTVPMVHAYDIKVSDRLVDLAWQISKGPSSNELTKFLDALSEEILEAIQKVPTEMPVTPMARHLKPSSFIGCGGHRSSLALYKSPRLCPKKREHSFNAETADEGSNGITFNGDYPYVLRPGQ